MKNRISQQCTRKLSVKNNYCSSTRIELFFHRNELGDRNITDKTKNAQSIVKRVE